MEAEAKQLADKAWQLTRADNNPLKADYYEASQLYAKAASIYDLGATKLKYIPNADPELKAWAEAKAKETEQTSRQLRFKAHQTRGVYHYRDRRGLL